VCSSLHLLVGFALHGCQNWWDNFRESLAILWKPIVPLFFKYLISFGHSSSGQGHSRITPTSSMFPKVCARGRDAIFAQAVDAPDKISGDFVNRCDISNCWIRTSRPQGLHSRCSCEHGEPNGRADLDHTSTAKALERLRVPRCLPPLILSLLKSELGKTGGKLMTRGDWSYPLKTRAPWDEIRGGPMLITRAPHGGSVMNRKQRFCRGRCRPGPHTVKCEKNGGSSGVTPLRNERATF
jgi:hypothetical protein